MIFHQKSSPPLLSILPLFHLPSSDPQLFYKDPKTPARLLSSMSFHTQESLTRDVVCGLLTLLRHLQIRFFSPSFKHLNFCAIRLHDLLCAGMLSCFSHVQLFVILWTTGSHVHGNSQARILQWVAISSSGGSS